LISVNGGVKVSTVTEEEGTTEAREAPPRAEGEARPKPAYFFELHERRWEGALGMGKMRELVPIKALVGIMAACLEGKQEILVLVYEFEEMHHA
jgi:hypothetical protein